MRGFFMTSARYLSSERVAAQSARAFSSDGAAMGQAAMRAAATFEAIVRSSSGVTVPLAHPAVAARGRRAVRAARQRSDRIDVLLVFMVLPEGTDRPRSVMWRRPLLDPGTRGRPGWATAA